MDKALHIAGTTSNLTVYISKTWFKRDFDYSVLL